MADFLRRRREALAPVDVGFVAAARRRARGLRREEIASLAHMSTDFYTRLEQCRGSLPSEQTIEALARALRLTHGEREHLFALAGRTPPVRAARTAETSPALLRVLDVIDAPAMIANDIGMTSAQNRHAIALVGVQTAHTGFRRSTYYRWFTDPLARRIHPAEDHELHSRTAAGALRRAWARSETDGEVRALVDDLLQRSDEFCALWERHEIATFVDLARKRFVHPTAGVVTLSCQTLFVDGTERSEKLLVLTADPGSPDAERLTRIMRPVSRELTLA